MGDAWDVRTGVEIGRSMRTIAIVAGAVSECPTGKEPLGDSRLSLGLPQALRHCRGSSHFLFGLVFRRFPNAAVMDPNGLT